MAAGGEPGGRPLAVRQGTSRVVAGEQLVEVVEQRRGLHEPSVHALAAFGAARASQPATSATARAWRRCQAGGSSERRSAAAAAREGTGIASIIREAADGAGAGPGSRAGAGSGDEPGSGGEPRPPAVLPG